MGFAVTGAIFTSIALSVTDEDIKKSSKSVIQTLLPPSRISLPPSFNPASKVLAVMFLPRARP